MIRFTESAYEHYTHGLHKAFLNDLIILVQSKIIFSNQPLKYTNKFMNIEMYLWVSELNRNFRLETSVSSRTCVQKRVRENTEGFGSSTTRQFADWKAKLHNPPITQLTQQSSKNFG